MTKDELGKLYPIELEVYKEHWLILFAKEKKILESIFGKGLRIEHIGSTAIRGISAKPTIDILLEQPEGLNNDQIIKIMESKKYIYMKEQIRHLMFVRGYTPKGLAKESYHIHIGPLGQGWLWDRVYFRDYLTINASEAKKYEKLKIKLASKFTNDREAYTDGKTGYIKEITERAKLELQ